MSSSWLRIHAQMSARGPGLARSIRRRWREECLLRVMNNALASVILAPDGGDMGEAVVRFRRDGESCGSGKGDDEGCADQQRDVVVEEELHSDGGFDEGE